MNVTTDEMRDQATGEPLLVLTDTGFVPYYEQIAQRVRSLIVEKKLKSGESFYSEGQMARMLGISKMPVRHAFQKLRSEGFLVIKRGKNPVIGGGPVQWNFRELHGFSEEMRSRGLVPSTKLLDMRLQNADPETAKLLHVATGQQVYRMKRLRFANGEPVAIVTSYLPAKLFPDLDKQDLEGQSLYFIIEHFYKRRLLRGEEVIGAATVGREEAQALQTVVGNAVLHINETTFDIEQTAIEFSISLLRADRYTVSVVSERRK